MILSTQRIQTGSKHQMMTNLHDIDQVYPTLTKSLLRDFDHLSDTDVDLENQYYNSKSLKEKDPKAALESFQRVLDLENGEKGKYFGRLYLKFTFLPQESGVSKP